MIRISASTNPCPEDKLVDYVKLLQDLKVDYMHCDVMSDNFVGRNCLPIELIRDIKENSLIPLDVHLMVNEPLNIIKQYCKCCITWTISYVINAIILEIFVKKLVLNVYIAQILATLFCAIFTYILFKTFAFRRKT